MAGHSQVATSGVRETCRSLRAGGPSRLLLAGWGFSVLLATVRSYERNPHSRLKEGLARDTRRDAYSRRLHHMSDPKRGWLCPWCDRLATVPLEIQVIS